MPPPADKKARGRGDAGDVGGEIGQVSGDDEALLTFALLCIVGGFAFSGLGLLWRLLFAVKPLIRALPLTLLNDALRGVMNDAMTLAQIGPKMLWLVVWGLVTFSVGVKIFRWQ